MQSNRPLCSCMDWHHADQQISISLVMATDTTVVVDASTLEGSLSPAGVNQSKVWWPRVTESGGCWSGSEAQICSFVCLWDDGARDLLPLISGSSTGVVWIRNRRATRWVRAQHSVSTMCYAGCTRCGIQVPFQDDKNLRDFSAVK